MFYKDSIHTKTLICQTYETEEVTMRVEGNESGIGNKVEK